MLCLCQHYRRFIRRLKNRCKPLLRWKQIYQWDYESCENCGACFKLAYSLRDRIWDDLYGTSAGCLCLNCAIEKALSKGIIIHPSDIEWLRLFYGDAGSYNLLE